MQVQSADDLKEKKSEQKNKLYISKEDDDVLFALI